MAALVNPRHERFAHAIANGEGTRQAYESAGYKPSSGSVQSAHRLMKHPRVKTRIEALREMISAKSVVSASVDRDWVMGNLRLTVDRGMQPDAETYNPTVATRALELIGKELGMFVERSVTVNVQAFSTGPDNKVKPKIIDL